MTAAGARRCVVLLAVFLCATPAAAQDAKRLMASVSAIAAAPSNAQRREAILAALERTKATVDLQAFGEGDRAGVNVVATVRGTGAASSTGSIVIGAHYDRVSVGQGAVDNGASCAALIELIHQLSAAPPANYTLTFVFFDREEAGLQGSRAYFAANAGRPAFAINLDIFAYGDTIFATPSHPAGRLLTALRAAGKAAGLAVRDVPAAQYPGSDHQSMMAAGIETVGTAIVSGPEVDAVIATGPKNLKPGSGPRIISIIHSPNDTIQEVRPDEMMKAIPVIEHTVRAIDRGD